MGFDFKDFLKKREDKGIHVSYSVDIRVVENFFKKLFGKSKKDESDKKNNKDNEKK
jgi:hypothetical protein